MLFNSELLQFSTVVGVDDKEIHGPFLLIFSEEEYLAVLASEETLLGLVIESLELLG